MGPILCFNFDGVSERVQFCVCCAYVFVCFIVYGYLQELIFTFDGFKPHGWYLTCVQFAFYGVFGFLERLFSKNTTNRRIPMRLYLLLSLLTMGTMGFSNASLGYLNYPTEVIFKCCKLVPVLIGGILIQGKRYNCIDFVAAFSMCIGLTFFTIAESEVSPNFNTTGVLMISIALLCDAIIGNIQEKYMKEYQASNSEVVLYSYSIGFVYIFVTLLLTGDFQKGFSFCSQDITRTYGLAFVFSLTGYLGIQMVLTLIRNYGAFVAVTVTTCRKAVTIILSFLIFSKPFTFQYLWSGLIVLFGIYLNVHNKHNPISLKSTLNGVQTMLKMLFNRRLRAEDVNKTLYYRSL